jgi:hypothetical protein
MQGLIRSLVSANNVAYCLDSLHGNNFHFCSGTSLRRRVPHLETDLFHWDFSNLIAFSALSTAERFALRPGIEPKKFMSNQQLLQFCCIPPSSTTLLPHSMTLLPSSTF